MKIKGWTYYNHAACPTNAPHKEINLKPIEDGSIWKLDGRPIFARWITDYDCNYETPWWYVIKDAPFDISKIKSKRRYEITKGERNFDVKRIDVNDYINELYSVQLAAFESWPKKYRPKIEKDSFSLSMKNWKSDIVYGAFERETNQLCGFALLRDHDDWMEFNILRVIPSYERKGINAAIIYKVLTEYNLRLESGFYIVDGARSIRHETNFQDYLEKYFGFRKAYCRLNIVYKRWLKLIVHFLYPFRGMINSKSKIGSMVSGVMFMEEICRKCKEVTNE